MRVGTLTFHHTYNYGAVMQAFCLAQAISTLGHEVEIIDLEGIYNKYYEGYETNLILRGRPPFINLHQGKYRGKHERFEAFIKDFLPTSRRLTTREDLESLGRELDVAVVGSDEVWRLTEGWHPAFFLDFGPDVMGRMSYAASFGGTSDPGERRAQLTTLLGRFNTILVRDDNSQRIVADLTGSMPPMAVDPVLLGALGPVEDHAPVAEEGPTVLVYAERQLSPSEVMAVRRQAKALNAKIVAIGFPHWFADKNLIDAGPLEFVAAMRSATVVVTMMFHGVVFALAYEKQLVVLSTKKKANKVVGLLAEMGLSQNFGDLDGVEIDYEMVTPRILEAREHSLELLGNGLANSAHHT